MSSRCLGRLTALVLVAWTIGQAGAAEPFRICAEPQSPPLSNQSDASGVEIDVGRILAEELKRPFEVKWVAQRDYAFFRQTLGKNVCDAIMSVPVGFDRLTMTKPWYRTGFVFVSRRGDVEPKGFDDARLASLSIGVPVAGLGDGTPPAIALARRSLVANLRPFSIYEPKLMVDAVVADAVDTAVMWGPFAGWFAAGQAMPLVLTRTPAGDGATPFVFDMAVGVRKGNEDLRDAIDGALKRRSQDIEVALDKWHVPHGADW